MKTMKSKFNVGDRVVVSDDTDNRGVGIIVEILAPWKEDDDYMYRVRFKLSQEFIHEYSLKDFPRKIKFNKNDNV